MISNGRNAYVSPKNGLLKQSGLTLVEVLVVVGILGILWVSVPAIGNALGVARDSSAQWQEKHLNSLYNQYLATGALPATDLSQAVEILVNNTSLQSVPPLNIRTTEGEMVLEFDNQTFAYVPSDSAGTGISDPRELVGSSPLVLNVRRSGGTATYGGQELPGIGALPPFMLSATNGEFRFHNSGGYEGIESIYSMQEFLADLEPSVDRFNPTSSKILSLEKNGARYDLDFVLWDSGLQLRLISIAKYE
jgi:prepilin-type N-terminal cleavage/methylation domain-containing protein